MSLTGGEFEELLNVLQGDEQSFEPSALMLRLRKRFPEAKVGDLALAIDTHIARRTAPEKLGAWAKEGYFSLPLLQQATRGAIAEYRAERFRGLNHVLEIGTGTGTDTAALAAVCRHVTSIDTDPVASGLAGRNLALREVTNVTLQVGAFEELLRERTGEFDGVFSDPARRTQDGRRVREADEYSPALDDLLDLQVGKVRAIKVSPGLFWDLRPGWIREFLGYGSECLEQTLWFGTAGTDSSVYLADRRVSWAPDPGVVVPSYAEVLEGYLVEAHGVVNRSQFLKEFFAERAIRAIAADVAYGIANTRPEPDPFISSFKILEAIPFQSKLLKRNLQERGWTNRTELKKRNFTPDIDEIRDQLKLPDHFHGGPFGVLFFFRWKGKPWVVISERLS